MMQYLLDFSYVYMLLHSSPQGPRLPFKTLTLLHRRELEYKLQEN